MSAWADAHRMLPATAAEPGRWRTSRTPYLAEVMNCLSVASPIERVVFMKGAQLGATEAGLNWLGYVIANAPGMMLYVMPTTEAARRTVRTRIDPLIETSPVLADRVVKARSRDPGNTATFKTYPGGHVAFVGANSAVGLRSTPARYLFLDEIDGFPLDADGEGDPVALAIARTTTFRGRRKVFMVSTPTIAGVSRIEKALAESDNRRFHVPCPACGVFQALEWRNVRWPSGRRHLSAYECEACGELLPETAKPQMLARGVWRATAPGDGKTAGFHLSSLYSPFQSWAEVAIEHGVVKGDPSRLQVWTNTSLGEVWEDRDAAAVTPENLMARSEVWPDDGPEGVALVTAGVDVGQDHIQIEVCGWGRGEESWSLDYITLRGSPTEPETWERLDGALTATYFGHPIAAACVDTGGHWAKHVYDFATPRHRNRVWAIKGGTTKGAPIWPRRPSKAKPGRPPLYVIGVDAAKEIAFARLAIEDDGPGRCHFPRDRDLDYFRMLTAERPLRRFVKGVASREWRKAWHSRAEAWDARVYNLAALHGLRAMGVDLEQAADRAERMRSAPPGTLTLAPPTRARTIASAFMTRP